MPLHQGRLRKPCRLVRIQPLLLLRGDCTSDELLTNMVDTPCGVCHDGTR